MTETKMLPQGSAVYSLAVEKAITAAIDARRPEPSEAELDTTGREADRVATFGVGYRTGRDGEPLQAGIGSPGNLNGNHFAALKKAEQNGRERPGSYEKAIAADPILMAPSVAICRRLCGLAREPRLTERKGKHQ